MRFSARGRHLARGDERDDLEMVSVMQEEETRAHSVGDAPCTDHARALPTAGMALALRQRQHVFM